MLTHVIQLLQCRLVTRSPICFTKLLKIWLDFLHARVHIKHGIVSLLFSDIMCTRSPDTFILLLKNWQLAQWNISYYMVPRCWRIHAVGAWEIHAWEVCNLFTHECLRNTLPNPCLVANHISKFFFNSLPWLYIHLNCTGPPTLPFQGKCTSKYCITLNHPGGNTFFILHTSTTISFSNLYIIAFETCLAQIYL
jgi:hypothetical protein